MTVSKARMRECRNRKKWSRIIDRLDHYYETNADPGKAITPSERRFRLKAEQLCGVTGPEHIPGKHDLQSPLAAVSGGNRELTMKNKEVKER